VKNKKLIFVLIISLLISSLVGCNTNNDQAEPERPAENIPGDNNGMDQNGNDQNQMDQNNNMDNETSMKKYKDGEYEAELDPDERGWRSVVKIEVENNEITNVDYDEFDENDKKKSEDEEYNKTWKSASDIDATEAYPQLEEELIKTQDVDQIETITGATGSTENFKEVVSKALEDATQ